jgi:cytoskeletal protein CcmA (bactofilin family)
MEPNNNSPVDSSEEPLNEELNNSEYTAEPTVTQPTEDTQSASESEAPADALSRTPEDLAEEQAQQIEQSGQPEEAPATKKTSSIKEFFRKVNVYFLGFILLIIIAAIVAIVTYLNSKKVPTPPNIATQELTEDALKQLANTDASVGDTSQTLTIQGNAVIAGQTLMRGNLNVAGNFQSGGSIQGPSLTISGTSNLGETQINSLQIAGALAVQGGTTMRDLNVAGTSTFSGAMTASQITVTRLIMSGNASLEIPNHISFTGPAPSRSINSGVLGAGGSASIDGSDTSGTLNINTGNNPSAGCFVQVTFNQRFSNQPHIIISPASAAAGRTQYYTERNNAGFSVCAATPAPANQVLTFDYFVMN